MLVVTISTRGEGKMIIVLFGVNDERKRGGKVRQLRGGRIDARYYSGCYLYLYTACYK